MQTPHTSHIFNNMVSVQAVEKHTELCLDSFFARRRQDGSIQACVIFGSRMINNPFMK